MNDRGLTPQSPQFEDLLDCGVGLVVMLLEAEHELTDTVKDQVESILSRLPDNCTLEDVQYHLYVIEKIRGSIDRADTQGTLTQEDVERRLKKWLTP